MSSVVHFDHVNHQNNHATRKEQAVLNDPPRTAMSPEPIEQHRKKYGPVNYSIFDENKLKSFAPQSPGVI
ncbi:hypothetical protein HED60_04300 [Planctomycetales bacterium ZRK34]|nr:hypothetical protein HED60_04300 [Planctomycetales bacterium ZRK34]